MSVEQHWMGPIAGPEVGSDRQDEQVRLRRQQGKGGVMFRAGIVNGELIKPFQVEDGVKINSYFFLPSMRNLFKNIEIWANSPPSISENEMTPQICLELRSF